MLIETGRAATFDAGCVYIIHMRNRVVPKIWFEEIFCSRCRISKALLLNKYWEKIENV